MRGFISTIAVAGLLAIGLTGCLAEEAPEGGSEGDAPAADVAAKCATCEKGRGGEDLFCEDCKKGFVGGEEATTCPTCFIEKQGGPACPT